MEMNVCVRSFLGGKEVYMGIKNRRSLMGRMHLLLTL